MKAEGWRGRDDGRQTTDDRPLVRDERRTTKDERQSHPDSSPGSGSSLAGAWSSRRLFHWLSTLPQPLALRVRDSGGAYRTHSRLSALRLLGGKSGRRSRLQTAPTGGEHALLVTCVQDFERFPHASAARASYSVFKRWLRPTGARWCRAFDRGGCGRGRGSSRRSRGAGWGRRWRGGRSESRCCRAGGAGSARPHGAR